MTAGVDELVSVAATYRLLARLWSREVDEALLQALRKPPLREAFVAAGGKLPTTVDPATLEELAIDYCQLFLGPVNHLPPFQSVWQRGQFQSQAAESMQQYVTLSGCQTGGQMPDHLGVQLDVMARLIDSMPEFPEAFETVFELVTAYFREHLTWPTSLLDFAIHRADTDFYRSTIRMTRDFLRSEASFWIGSHG